MPMLSMKIMELACQIAGSGKSPDDLLNLVLNEFEFVNNATLPLIV